MNKRFVLTGSELGDFPSGHDGVHVNVVLPEPRSALPNLDINSAKTALNRSYALRAFEPTRQKLAIDSVVNRHEAPAANRAPHALDIAGSGARKLTDFSADSYLLVGE